MSTRAPTQRVHPSQEILQAWADHLLPDLDVWFWNEREPDFDLTGGVVMTRAEYLSHPTYRGIEYVNAYLHWQMPPEVTQVIVSDPAWIASLDPDDRRRVLEHQVAPKRGLVYPRSHFDALPEGLDAHTVADTVVLSHAAWALVPDDQRRLALVREQARWDEVDCYAVPDAVPTHIRAIANTFGVAEGTNCLSTTAYAITGDEALRELWMTQPVFHEIIERHGYQPASTTSPETGDILIFAAGGTTVHAAYCVGHDRYLNKNGQSRFNPTRIVDRTMLDADWPGMTCTTYRQPPHHGDGR